VAGSYFASPRPFPEASGSPMASLARALAAAVAFSATPPAGATLGATCSVDAAGAPVSCEDSFAGFCAQLCEDDGSSPVAAGADRDLMAWEALLAKCPQCDSGFFQMMPELTTCGETAKGEIGATTGENVAVLSQQECSDYAAANGKEFQVGDVAMDIGCGCQFFENPVTGYLEEVSYWPDAFCDSGRVEKVGSGLFYVCKSTAETGQSPFTCPSDCSNPARLYSTMPRIFGATAVPLPAGLAVALLLFTIATAVRRRPAGRASSAQADEGLTTDPGSQSHRGQDAMQSALISRA